MCIRNLLKQLFGDSDTSSLNADPVTYSIGGGWADRITWVSDFNEPAKEFRVAGWKSRIPRSGDLLTGKFTKGTVVFIFKKVEPQNDPADMFFADVACIGYKHELGENVLSVLGKKRA